MKINSIIIVGGGSSGWMTAALLSKSVPDIKITLIESKNVPIIGVGESTLNAFNRFIELLEIQEKDWMPKCNAIYKTSIRFTDFFEKDFSYHDTLKQIVPPVDMKVNDFYHLCHQYPSEFKVTDFPKFFDDNHYMTVWNRYTNLPDNNIMNWNPRTERAYHFDAYKFGVALKELVAIPNSVNHIQDEIYAVRTDDNGIFCLETMENGAISADLYIDCSGFRSILLEKSLGIKLIDFSEKITNNRAISTNIEYKNPDKEMETFTDCIAMSSGWVWNIPIWNRIGAGYVYSSDFINEENAVEEFKQNLKKRFDVKDNELQFRHMNFNPGVRESPWYKNVVGVGLSCGFLGPLRSTGLALTQEMIENLAAILLNTEGNIKKIDIEFYNDSVIKRMKRSRDWVSAQSVFSRRTDTPYWIHRTQNVVNSEDSEYFKNIFESLLKKEEPKIESKKFNISYNRVLAGAGYGYLTKLDYNLALKREHNFYYRIENIKNSWYSKQILLKEYISSLPTTYQFLKKTIYQESYERT
jgi:Tryptophan halogenase